MVKKVLGNRGFWLLAMLIIMGAFMLNDSLKDKKALEQGVTDFNEMTELDFIPGRYVSGTVYELLDEFAYEEEYQRTFGIKHGERVSSHYYLLPLQATADSDTPQYAALCIGNTQLAEQAQQMLDEYWEYLDTGEEPEVWTEFYITGKISKLDGELLDYFYDWFYWIDEDMTREDIEPMVCPYMITYQVAGAASDMMVTAIIMIAVGIIGIAIMIIVMAKQGDKPLTAFSGNSSVDLPTGAASGYNPVNSENSGASQQDSQFRQPQNSEGYKDMDSLDTSGLGIGIGDEDR